LEHVAREPGVEKGVPGVEKVYAKVPAKA